MCKKIHSSLAKRLRGFASDRSGNITLFFALSAIPFVAAAGIALDYSRGVSARTGLQQVADAAALAAAAPDTATEAQRKAVALRYVDANKSVLSGVEIKDKVVTIGPNTVDVALLANIEGTLTRVMAQESGVGAAENGGNEGYKGKFDVGAKSKAAFGKDGYMCLEALHNTAQNSIYFFGNVDFLASSCSVHTNSNNSQAMYTQGNAYAEAASFCAVGGWVGSGYSNDPKGGCPTRTDPYTAYETAANAELASATTRSNAQLHVKNATMNLQPGIYKGGISVETGGIANFAAGTYFIKDGGFLMSSSAVVNANTGVTIYLVGNGPTSGSGKNPSIVSIGSQSNLHLKAPTTGPLASMALMQASDSNVNDVAGVNTIISGGTVNIEGGVYMPQQTFKITANGDMNQTSKYFPIIAKKFEMGGTATLYVNLDWAAAGFPDPANLKTEGYHLLTE